MCLTKGEIKSLERGSLFSTPHPSYHIISYFSFSNPTRRDPNFFPLRAKSAVRNSPSIPSDTHTPPRPLRAKNNHHAWRALPPQLTRLSNGPNPKGETGVHKTLGHASIHTPPNKRQGQGNRHQCDPRLFRKVQGPQTTGASPVTRLHSGELVHLRISRHAPWPRHVGKQPRHANGAVVARRGDERVWRRKEGKRARLGPAHQGVCHTGRIRRLERR